MRTLISCLVSLLSLVGLTAPARATPPIDNVYNLQFTSIDGAPLPLSTFKGKVVLVVNTASKCGFTPQYDGLEKLYTTYQDQGFVILGVPSNDFGGQEPGNEKQIKTFCQTHFNITFPMTDKQVVSGNAAHPFYKQVRAQLGYLASPHWNFYKYLISRDGHIVAWYSSKTKPDSDMLTKAIESELAKK